MLLHRAARVLIERGHDVAFILDIPLREFEKFERSDFETIGPGLADFHEVLPDDGTAYFRYVIQCVVAFTIGVTDR